MSYLTKIKSQLKSSKSDSEETTQSKKRLPVSNSQFLKTNYIDLDFRMESPNFFV